ncbi:MAG TPA: HEAT repeat domain-containing protein [Polyangia bacterium]|nr:HEAT repeat domain-containing protein [Polyangia bacterium]
MGTRNATVTGSLSLVLGLALMVAAGPAQAGRGGSPELIGSAIAANSVDAIQAELERSEYLVCAACTDLVLPLVDHADYRVRRAAAWWLSRRSSGRTVFVGMLNRLSQPDSAKAANAADVLGEFGSAAAIPALSAALSNPIFDGNARAAMARALGSIGRPAGAAALVGALGASEPAVKVAALGALRELRTFNGAGAVPAAALLGDADANVRSQAALTLGAAHAPAGVAELLQVLGGDPSADVRKRAAWALGEMGAPAAQAADGLGRAAQSDASPLVRSLAEVAIGKLTR